MNRLMLMRHAKSSWKDPALADFDRPLNRRGRYTAKFVAELIAERCWVPDLILSSSAVRAMQTAETISRTWSRSVTILRDDRLYMAEAATIIDVLKGVQGAADILLIAHNPGLENLLSSLMDQQDLHLPTAAFAVIEHETDWPSVSCGTLAKDLKGLYKPKEQRGYTYGKF